MRTEAGAAGVRRNVWLATTTSLLALASGAADAQTQWDTTFEKVERGEWPGPRLPDGQPDIQGHWSNTIANQNNFTDPQGGIPGDPTGVAGGSAADLGREAAAPPRSARAPSRVSDPPDGQLPFRPWARAKQQELLANFFEPTRPEYIEPLARCAPAGPTKSLYWHGYEIRQFPGYVLFIFDSGSRLIHLDDKPHLPEQIKLWNADSRGYWEGNTLVVDVTNNNAKARLARTGEFTSPNVRIVEHYIFDNDGQHYTYEAVYDDPATFTRPWTVTIPARRVTLDTESSWHNSTEPATLPSGEVVQESVERVCVENNEGHGEVALPSK